VRPPPHGRRHGGLLRRGLLGRVLLLVGLLGHRCGGAGAELGHASLGGLQLGLQLLVLGVDGAQGVDDLVEVVVDLVLVVSLAKLGRLELLVENVVCTQQSHVVSLGSGPSWLDATRVLAARLLECPAIRPVATRGVPHHTGDGTARRPI
jgi:hypothetical protein